MAQVSTAQRAVAELLLAVFLPRLDAELNSSSGSGGGSRGGIAELRGNLAMLEGSSQAGKALLGMLCPLLSSPALLPAVTRYLQRQQPWRAALQHAVRCCTALPASSGQGLPLQQQMLHLELHSEAFRLVGLVASSGFQGTGAAVRSTAAGSGSGSNGSSQLPAVALLRRLVPHARAVISTVAALQQYPLQQLHLFNLCSCMAMVLPELQPPQQLGVRDLAGWAVAADAGIRLLPLLTSPQLANLEPQPQLAGTSLAGVQPARPLVLQLLQLFVLPAMDMSSLSDQLGGPQPDVLLRLLMQCHASSCRLLHWLAADPAHVQLGGQELPLQSLLPQLACALHTNLKAICTLTGFVEQGDKLRWGVWFGCRRAVELATVLFPVAAVACVHGCGTCGIAGNALQTAALWPAHHRMPLCFLGDHCRLRVQGVCHAHWHALCSGAAIGDATSGGNWAGAAPATTTAALVLCCKRFEALASDPEFFPTLKGLLASLDQVWWGGCVQSGRAIYRCQTGRTGCI